MSFRYFYYGQKMFYKILYRIKSSRDMDKDPFSWNKRIPITAPFLLPFILLCSISLRSNFGTIFYLVLQSYFIYLEPNCIITLSILSSKATLLTLVWLFYCLNDNAAAISRLFKQHKLKMSFEKCFDDSAIFSTTQCLCSFQRVL